MEVWTSIAGPGQFALHASWIGSTRFNRLLTLISVITVGWAVGLPAAYAGLSGSEVVVVVNGASLNSRTLANHFISLRQIPAANVVVLDEVPSSEVVAIDVFREKILKPLLQAIDERKLASNVKCIAYSADFPTAIDISEELKPLGKLPEYVTGKASINALTYFYQLVLIGSPDYAQLDVNFYARNSLDRYFTSPAGKVTAEAWGTIEQLIEDKSHAEAADALEALLKDYPEQFPMAYLAAAQASLADDAPRAIRLLQAAVSAGWNAGGYLAQDARFDAVRDQAEFQVLELLLDASIETLQPSVGFETLVQWAPNGVPSPQAAAGMRYLMSTVLGVTRGMGTSLPEAVACLERAATADSTHPDGTFFYTDTDDVRTKTRRAGFAAAVAELQSLGYAAEVVNSTLPMKQPAILGVQFGSPKFAWKKTGSSLVPGAIADNLTSFGGIMFGNAGQTKLTELLKVGAAGSSGTVVEPYALQEKFPTPQLYVHYARGASLAEAFYQSVTGPFQLLIVGDPLCRPFSNAPRPELDTSLRILEDTSLVTVDIQDVGVPYADWLELDMPRARRAEPLAASTVAIVLDGQLARSLPASKRLEIRTGRIAPGYHDIRLKFIAEDPLSQRSEFTIPVWKGGQGLINLEIAGAPADASTSSSTPPTLSLKSEMLAARISTQNPGAAAVEKVHLQHDSEIVASVEAAEGDVVVPLSRLGMGPVRLQAVAELSDGSRIQSVPVWIVVAP